MTNRKGPSVSLCKKNNKNNRVYSLGRGVKFIAAFGLAFSAFIPAADAHVPDCKDFEGTFTVKTAQRRYYRHAVILSVDQTCRISGRWNHTSGGGGHSTIDGRIDGDIIEFSRVGSGVRQSYTGNWSPGFFNGQGFAAGTFDSTGVWYMQRDRR